MHGTAPTTRKVYDRSAITRAAWARRKAAADRQATFDAAIANELQCRAKFIDGAATDAERARRVASVTASAKPFVTRPVVPTWAECMKLAWAEAKTHRTETTGFAARRFAAECCESDVRRRAELEQIDREERAAQAA